MGARFAEGGGGMHTKGGAVKARFFYNSGKQAC
jgi:hypothetical protein